MRSWVLLLRGINVGGSGKLPMADLRTLLADLGAQDVATNIQSGNAVFRGVIDPADFTRRIADGIEARFGFRRDALVLPGAKIQSALDSFPFPVALEDPKTGHVWFLTGPAAPDLDALQNLAADGEEFQLGHDLFYLHSPNGIGRSKLAARVEKLLGIPATARNLNSVAKLAGMVAALEG